MKTELTNQNFNEIINSAELVIVDFYADWCGPCKMLGRTFDELLEEDQNINILKVNVDEFPEIAAEYQISSIPAVFAFKNGKVLDNFVGTMPLMSLKDFIQRNKSK